MKNIAPRGLQPACHVRHAKLRQGGQLALQLDGFAHLVVFQGLRLALRRLAIEHADGRFQPGRLDRLIPLQALLLPFVLVFGVLVVFALLPCFGAVLFQQCRMIGLQQLQRGVAQARRRRRGRQRRHGQFRRCRIAGRAQPRQGIADGRLHRLARLLRQRLFQQRTLLRPQAAAQQLGRLHALFRLARQQALLQQDGPAFHGNGGQMRSRFDAHALAAIDGQAHQDGGKGVGQRRRGAQAPGQLHLAAGRQQRWQLLHLRGMREHVSVERTRRQQALQAVIAHVLVQFAPLEHQLQRAFFGLAIGGQQARQQHHVPAAPVDHGRLRAGLGKTGEQRIAEQVVEPLRHRGARAFQRIAPVGGLQQLAQAYQQRRVQCRRVGLGVELVPVAQAFIGQRAILVTQVMGIKMRVQAPGLAQQGAAARRRRLHIEQHAFLAPFTDKLAGALPQRRRDLRQAAHALLQLRLLIQACYALRQCQYFFKHRGSVFPVHQSPCRACFLFAIGVHIGSMHLASNLLPTKLLIVYSYRPDSMYGWMAINKKKALPQERHRHDSGLMPAYPAAGRCWRNRARPILPCCACHTACAPGRPAVCWRPTPRRFPRPGPGL